MLELLTPRLEIERKEGRLILRSGTPMPEPARAVGDWLIRWAREKPDVTFLAERDANNAWTHLSYANALAKVESIGSALLDRGAVPQHPLMILSDNSIDQALLALAAMCIGVPVAPVSPAYSLLSKSFARLKDVAAQLDAAFVYAGDLRFAPALKAIASDRLQVLDNVAELAATPGSSAFARAFHAITPSTIAKVLFTSGSTGRPKGVVNTHRMLTSNQESLAACWPFLASSPPIIVDWLPWSHTFGGNHNFNLILRNGGSLYIDRGRPVPGLIERTVENLADISPTLWFNVPRGFDQVVALLEKDPAIAARVFARMQLVFYAAAALSPATRARLEQIANGAGRSDVFFTSAWGSTETSPLATSAHFPTRTTGILGVPVPGVELALAPVQDKHELRVRGPNVTPGYWRASGVIEPVALDEDGFLPTGDAGRLANDQRPEDGVIFGGRLGENFKLSSGTWVNVAEVRLAVVDACAPLILDAVIAGHDRENAGALLFPSAAAKDLDPASLAARLAEAIAKHNRAHKGSSERIARALVLTEPLSLDEGETTDKGYTNQRRVLERRSEHVERLFAERPETAVLCFNPEA